MSDELKACSTPWCHNPVAHFIGTYHSINKCYVKDVSVICLGCGIKLNKTFASEAEAIAAWNTRPIEDALRQRVKELEEELDAIKIADRKDADMACHYYLKCQKIEAWQKEAVKSIKTLIGIVEGEWGDLALAAFHAEIEDNSNFLINVKKLIEQAEEHEK